MTSEPSVFAAGDIRTKLAPPDCDGGSGWSQRNYKSSGVSPEKTVNVFLKQTKAKQDIRACGGKRQSGNVCCRTPEKKKESGRRI